MAQWPGACKGAQLPDKRGWSSLQVMQHLTAMKYNVLTQC